MAGLPVKEMYIGKHHRADPSIMVNYEIKGSRQEPLFAVDFAACLMTFSRCIMTIESSHYPEIDIRLESEGTSLKVNKDLTGNENASLINPIVYQSNAAGPPISSHHH